MEIEVKQIKGTVQKIKGIEEFKTRTGKTMWTCGILLDEKWINIREFKKESAEQKLLGVEEGKEYIVFMEVKGKYENVKSFVPSGDHYNTCSEEELNKTKQEVDNAIGGGTATKPTSRPNGARNGMIFNNAIALCIAENKTTKEDIKNTFEYLRDLLDVLEK